MEQLTYGNELADSHLQELASVAKRHGARQVVIYATPHYAGLLARLIANDVQQQMMPGVISGIKYRVAECKEIRFAEAHLLPGKSFLLADDVPTSAFLSAGGHPSRVAIGEIHTQQDL